MFFPHPSQWYPSAPIERSRNRGQQQQQKIGHTDGNSFALSHTTDNLRKWDHFFGWHGRGGVQSDKKKLYFPSPEPLDDNDEALSLSFFRFLLLGRKVGGVVGANWDVFVS